MPLTPRYWSHKRYCSTKDQRHLNYYWWCSCCHSSDGSTPSPSSPPPSNTMKLTRCRRWLMHRHGRQNIAFSHFADHGYDNKLHVPNRFVMNSSTKDVADTATPTTTLPSHGHGNWLWSSSSAAAVIVIFVKAKNGVDNLTRGGIILAGDIEVRQNNGGK